MCLPVLPYRPTHGKTTQEVRTTISMFVRTNQDIKKYIWIRRHALGSSLLSVTVLGWTARSMCYRLSITLFSNQHPSISNLFLCKPLLQRRAGICIKVVSRRQHFQFSLSRSTTTFHIPSPGGSKQVYESHHRFFPSTQLKFDLILSLCLESVLTINLSSLFRKPISTVHNHGVTYRQLTLLRRPRPDR